MNVPVFTGLSLFTGSGIGDLVFREIIPGYRTVAYVENSPGCVAHLIKSIKDRLIDDAPIWDDIRTFDTTPYKGMVDIVFGGFPCQPFSVAGKRKGEADERNCWPDTIRVIGEVRPRYAFLENVPGLVAHEYFRRIQGDLAEIFYDCVGLPLSAAEVGANHKREREWMLAWDTNRRDGNEGKIAKVAQGEATQPAGICADVAYPNKSRVERCKKTRDTEGKGSKQVKQPVGFYQGHNNWAVEPSVGRVVNGLAGRIHRLKMLGNGQVPQCISRILNVQKG